jgi:hypothetical protein
VSARQSSTMCTVAASLFLTFSVEAAQEPRAVEVLRAALGTAIEYQPEPLAELRYCPDNTCEVFRASHRNKARELTEFALVYLWRLSGYEALRPWRAGNAPAELVSIRARYARSCSKTSSAVSKCILVLLARDAGIHVAFGRYDEGEYTEEPFELFQLLGRVRVHQ